MKVYVIHSYGPGYTSHVHGVFTNKDIIKEKMEIEDGYELEDYGFKIIEIEVDK